MNDLSIDITKKYLVAVSGGADSIFMLDQLIKIIDNKNIVVCHVNYNYRSDSNFDQQLVTDFCKQNNLQLEVLNVKQNYSELKNNFESWARFKRYDFFNKIANQYKIFDLLVAHNYNDLIETYLLQKQRNSLVSYYGLKSITKYKDLTIYRPILAVKKSYIINYLNESKINYITDWTNDDLKFQRNKIRSTLNENDFESILNQIKIDNLKLEKINQIVDNFLDENLVNDELELTKQLYEFDHQVVQRIIYNYFKKINKEHLLINRSNKTIVEITKTLISSKKNFWKITLNNFSLIKDYNKLFIIANDSLKTKTLEINNLDDLANQTLFNNISELEKIIIDQKKFSYIITNDFEKYKLETTVDHKKTNRYFIDKKIRYKSRILNPVLYNKKDKIILNKIKKYY
ncbi:tRNA lysidine(34) synthetase TilS [Mycoplasma putrefaciens]|uniref:tRNA(Ile)-lysidine synthase n=1 Tax=Mycoplasma putrefaciens (strain ATCC 15718 / NCTC 10155 / C30 KS-1 / KS-1) TaxID=743965 RepID=A0A7U3ZT57_MYCPK|nr:tRNA lysidine(34) synthetase TilS [Mycoplasma putrefaciens]AEM69046.1 tRNA(Ile)-lysidine synthetase [Mycoplasma putrefaciens KS1]